MQNQSKDKKFVCKESNKRKDVPFFRRSLYAAVCEKEKEMMLEQMMLNTLLKKVAIFLADSLLSNTTYSVKVRINIIKPLADGVILPILRQLFLIIVSGLNAQDTQKKAAFTMYRKVWGL